MGYIEERGFIKGAAYKGKTGYATFLQQEEHKEPSNKFLFMKTEKNLEKKENFAKMFKRL